MRLFSLREIIQTARLKHGGADGISAAQERSEQRRANLRATRLANAN